MPEDAIGLFTLRSWYARAGLEQATGDWCVDVGFNAKYLSDALAQLGDKTRFRILKRGVSHLAAHLSSGEDSFHVVMPMRL